MTDSKSAPTSVTSSPTGRISDVVNILKDYKELIGFFVFFLVGILWAFAYFATKQQLVELKCLMISNITIVQGKMDAANLSQLLLQNQQAIAPL